MVEVLEIIESLENFIKELISISDKANSNMDENLGKQKFSRWHERLVDFLSDNISAKESIKYVKLNYPMAMQTKPLQNFNRKIDVHKSYLTELKDELLTNPELIINDTKSLKIVEKKESAGQKDKLKVFISYSTTDKEIAHQFSQKLKEWGLNVFLAHEDMEVSDEWEKEILKNLFNCEVFIPIITENFRNSRN